MMMMMMVVVLGATVWPKTRSSLLLILLHLLRVRESYLGVIGYILGLYGDTGKQNGNY